jgi:FlaA1/EpsC-like NDP-sugar epimerase
VILDSSEFALYRIHQELSVLVDAQPNPVRLVPVLGNVLSKTLLSKVFSDFNIDTVYHAAAYKHVPLVESNPVEGFINNVIGTLNLAKLSRENSVDRFVLISTDKAVRPTNVMGATKRIAELVVCGLASGSTDTRFSVVRFGNVLGSSGSVVPLFQRQIAEGGPVTVTDPNVIRYFMTIPEAALLVVQAGSLAKGGEIFLLDMGKAVKIVDLARKMIRLAGYKSTLTAPKDGEIQIEFCGLRPGEKLYEELLIDGNPIASSHPKIFYAKEPVLDLDAFQVLLDQLSDTEKLTHDRLRQILREYVPGYLPTIEEDLAYEP